MSSLKEIRQDFPLLVGREGDGKRIVYLDNGCQSLRPVQVTRAMADYYDHLSACGGAGLATNSLAVRTTEACARAREKVARFLGADPMEVVWQPNTTYGLNLVVRGLTMRSCPGDLRVGRGDEVLTTDLEHHSGYLPVWLAAREAGVRHRTVAMNEDGTFDLTRFQDAFTRRTKLVAVIWSSNMTGTTLPVREVVRIAHDHGARVLVDGAQYVPHHPVDAQALELDFLAFSLHKMCGPAGMGVLFGREELLQRLPPSVVGGEVVSDLRLTRRPDGRSIVTPDFLPPPARFEPGLQNFAGIIGSGAAVDYLRGRVGMPRIEEIEAALRRRLLRILAAIPSVRILGPRDPGLPDRGALVTFTLSGSPADPTMPAALSAWMEDRVEGCRIMIRTSAELGQPG